VSRQKGVNLWSILYSTVIAPPCKHKLLRETEVRRSRVWGLVDLFFFFFFFIFILIDRRLCTYDGRDTFSTYGERGPFPFSLGLPAPCVLALMAAPATGPTPRRPTPLGGVCHPTLWLRLGRDSLLSVGSVWVGLAS
jgi:hypothetical protein